MRVIQFSVADKISIGAFDNSVHYGLLSPSWVNFMMDHGLSELELRSSHAELSSREETFFNNELASANISDWNGIPISISSQPRLHFIYSNFQSRNKFPSQNHDNDLRKFGALVGGSFGNSYIPNLPIQLPIENSNQQFMYYFPRERLNAESLSKWLLAIPPTFRQEMISMYNLSKIGIHASDWYGMHIRARIRPITTTSLTSSKRTTFRAEISLVLFLTESNSSNPNQIIENYSFRSNKFYHHQVIISNPLFIDGTIVGHNMATTLFSRQVYGSQSLPFQVHTSINLKLLPISGTLQELVESIPLYYSIDLPSFEYYCGPDSLGWRHVSELGNISFLDDSCQFYHSNETRSQNQARKMSYSIHKKCLRTISIQVDDNLARCKNSLLHLRFIGRKSFIVTELLPPDASYGGVIPPMLLGVQLANDSALQWLSSPSLLISYPIPDRTMPYNVLTMVATLFSFVLGSLLNLLLRKWKADKSISNVENSTEK